MRRACTFGSICLGLLGVTGCGGGSAATTGAASATATTPVASNAYLRELDASCASEMPAIRLAVEQAEEVEKGSRSGASGPTAGPESTALAAVEALNRVRKESENKYVMQESRGNEQEAHPVIEWGLDLQYMIPDIGYFVNPESKSATATAAEAAPRLVTAVHELGAWALRAELPDCAVSRPQQPATTQTSTATASAAASQGAESCGTSSNETLKSTLETVADQAHLVGFSKSEGDCFTNIKVEGEWAAATWPATQPQAMVFRRSSGHWQAVTGGTAIDEDGREPVPKAVLEGEP
jgi:hypothetical protein